VLQLHELHVYDDPEPLSAAMNMAVDEALLETATAPTLRFYRWERPSVSFGYFGKLKDARAAAAERQLVRRWTGGGIVLHDDDVTYSVILPRDKTPSREVYAAIHTALQQALNGCLAARLADAEAPKISDACFANPVVADVLIAGRKIAGAAHRRTRAGLLHQGSIQHPQLPNDLRERFATTLCAAHQRCKLSAALRERAAAIAQAKYATREWLERR
jgi:lipoyl(octanoyl) transferase